MDHPTKHLAWNVRSLTGIFSLTFGAMGLAAVLCLRFPGLLTTPELRSLYPLPWIRAMIQGVLVLAFGLGWVNAIRHRRKLLGLSGVGLSLLAFLIGGPSAPVGSTGSHTYLGLDWFLLDLLFTALVFIPLERLFTLRAEQPVFRKGFRTDLAHFFVSHASVQLMMFLAMLPAMFAFRFAGSAGLQTAVGAQPVLVQLVEIMILADLSEYWIHRTFHAVPFLWRFHSIHHSSTSLDWIAGSRLHIAEVLVMRGLTYVPIYFLGFEQKAVVIYLTFVAVHAMLIHGNLRWNFGKLERWFVTPRFHHWHHGADVYDVNFALHFPVLDRLFGTYHMPDNEWPARYGVDGYPELGHYFAHLLYPFRSK
jgi:lathosterol oxidase